MDPLSRIEIVQCKDRERRLVGNTMDEVYTGQFLGPRGGSVSLNPLAGDSTPCWTSGI